MQEKKEENLVLFGRSGGYHVRSSSCPQRFRGNELGIRLQKEIQRFIFACEGALIVLGYF